MFDIGFSELVLIFIVGLVVLGPQRMPVAIRTVMGWIRTIRGLAANVQNELAQELKLQELKDSIKKAEALNLSALSPELSKTVEDLKQSAAQMQSELSQAQGEIKKLSDEQVAEIQAKIEAESQQIEVEQTAQQAVEKVQNFAKNQPLAEGLPKSEQELSPEELAEMAELDEEKLAEQLSLYYTDDDLASMPEQTNSAEKSNANS